MNYSMIFNILGKVVTVEAAFMLPALVIALCCGESSSVLGFAVAMAAMLALGLPLTLKKPKRTDIFAREGLITVGLAWLFVSLLGALPFCISRAIPNYIDCFFETSSGFTTTGATILSEIESLPRSILYWRSFTHWLGGMGVLVFLMILNPLSEKNSGENMHILRAESPGIKISKLVPRMKTSAGILYMIYIALTVLEFLFLWIGKEPLFDSVTIALSTAGTGGFAIKNDSLASYGAYTQWVVTVFMLLFSVNFNIYFLMLLGQFKKVGKNSELRTFLILVLCAVIVLMINTRGYFATLEESARTCAFQVLAVLSTTGFCTADFDRWPEFSRALMAILLFCGACAGSTGGGAKIIRLQILFKSVYRSIYKAFHPNAVRLIHMDGEVLDEDTVSGVGTYFLLYFVIIAVTTVLISVDGYNFESNFTAAVTCMNNVGPGLGAVGAVMNYSGFSAFSKIVLSLVMLIGRLEIYPMLVLFFPSAWKNN